MKRLLVLALALVSFQASASLSVDGVWKAGVWATTVFADGVWREGAYVGPSFDLTGLPLDCPVLSNLIVNPYFLELMRQEANGDGVWAYWLPGTTHNTANLKLNVTTIEQEADGTPSWAYWSAGLPRTDANLHVCARTAVTLDFVPN